MAHHQYISLFLSFGWILASLHSCHCFITPSRSHKFLPSPLVPLSSKDAFHASPNVQHPARIPNGGTRLLSANPLISKDDTWGNAAVLIGSAALAPWLGQATRWGRLLGAPVSAMALTFTMATIGILQPGGTATAKSIQLLAIQLATPLVLLGADLRNARKSCGPLLLSFTVAALGTMIACIVGWKYVAGKSLLRALGRDGLVIAAALMAKNVGGGINYIAVCRSLDASPTAVAAGLCVDNIFALIYFPITSALANRLPDVTEWSVTKTDPDVNDRPIGEPITAQTTTVALFLAGSLIFAGEKLGGLSWALPICSLLTVAIASVAPIGLIRFIQPTSDVLGLTALYLFFSTAGAPGLAVADSVKSSLIPLGLFLTSLYSIHGILLAAIHAVWGKSVGAFVMQRLLVASSAAIGGPATAAALASTAGWSSLVVPSILVGNIGYAVATLCGIAFHHAFSQ